MTDCLFCRIADQKETAFVILEDEEHLAFLDLYPNRRGQTVVITKEHHDSYPFDMPEEKFLKLLSFSRKTAKTIDKHLGSIRTFLVIEGMEINHVHVKLYPIYQIASNTSQQEKFFETYDGFLTSEHGPKADEGELEDIAIKIQSSVNG